jgi:hypothetical protein
MSTLKKAARAAQLPKQRKRMASPVATPSAIDAERVERNKHRPAEIQFDPRVMLYDVFARGRTPEAQQRLERAMLFERDVMAGASTPAGWLNHNLMVAIEGAEDEMWVDPKTGAALNDKGKRIKAKPAPSFAARTYVVTIDEETQLKYGNASEETGIPIEELIAGGAAHNNRTNGNTETHLDSEIVLWLIEASAPVRLEKRRAKA